MKSLVMLGKASSHNRFYGTHMNKSLIRFKQTLSIRAFLQE